MRFWRRRFWSRSGREASSRAGEGGGRDAGAFEPGIPRGRPSEAERFGPAPDFAAAGRRVRRDDMKTLLLIRHAKSSWKDAGRPDFDRPLNKRGKRDAPEMGRRLRERGRVPDLILSSPARRARKTAGKIAREMGYPRGAIRFEESLYGGGAAGVLSAIRRQDDSFQSLAVVGHNPALTELANRLGDREIDNIPTCGVVVLRFDVDRWEDVGDMPGVCEDFDFPRKEG